MKAIIYHYGYKSMSLEYRFLKNELYDGRQFTSTNILFNILFICFVKQIDRCDDHSYSLQPTTEFQTMRMLLFVTSS